MNKSLEAAEEVLNRKIEWTIGFSNSGGEYDECLNDTKVEAAKLLAQLATDLSAMLTPEVVEAGERLRTRWTPENNTERTEDDCRSVYVQQFTDDLMEAADFALSIIAKLREEA